MNKTGHPTQHARFAAATLLAAALLLLQRPYHGIWHDSLLYLGGALAKLHPDAFRHDLFFAFGSQSDHSLFPWLLARLLAHFDAASVFLWLTLAGLTMFALASWQLIRRLLSQPLRYPALLALLVFSGSYGAWDILSYAEPFLTARSFAEPLALASLAALVARRYWLAGIAWCLAAALHPLQVLPVLVVAWVWLAQGNRRWLRLAWTVPVAAAACMLLPQLSFAVTRMDAPWHAQVWQRNLVVFYSHAGPGDWYYLLTDVFIVGVAARHARDGLRRYLFALLAATVLLLTASLLLADLWHFAKPAALQLWRVHWLLHWSAMALLPRTCVQLWNAEPAPLRPRLLLFTATVLLGCTPTNAHPLVPGVVLLYLLWPRLRPQLSAPMQAGIALLPIAIAIVHLLACWGLQKQWSYWLPLSQWPSPILQSALPVAVPLLAVLGPIVWMRAAGPTARSIIALLAVLLFAGAAWQWDQRTQINRAFTASQVDTVPFGIILPADSQVLWPGNLLATWNILHRANYIDQQQLGGIVFNRATSVEGYLRKERMHVTDGKGRDCRIVVFPLEPYAACDPDETALRQACENAMGELDYVIVTHPLERTPLGTWSPNTSPNRSYHLYACSNLVAPASISRGKTVTP